ncbi:hypothetical protein [Sphaerisporangium perillae]|uniref:hypothetical protein n=1 Tax=Sphaerisporangium perillae TaxID=2935860 RepID=UPI002010319F|nr:hypothetical protein [Sphaerisporangium perillae]
MRRRLGASRRSPLTVADEGALLRICASDRDIRPTTGRDLIVEADALRRLCHRYRDKVDPRGVTLRHATIDGGLDLSGMAVPFPLRFLDCAFSDPLVVDGADLAQLTLDGCALPGLIGNGLRVRRDLDLSRSTINGAHATPASTSRAAAVWLCESEIGGRLLCVDTRIDSGGERAIQADRMRVGGTVRLLHEFTAYGELRLLGARIEGSLDFTGARLDRSGDGLALDLGDATIGGSLFLIDSQEGRRASINGRVDMGNARIAGQLLLRNATILPGEPVAEGRGYARARKGGSAISAPGLFVGGDVSFEGGCHIGGGIDFSVGDIGRVRVARDCRLEAPGGRALDLSNAELRSSVVFDEGTRVQGTLRLSGANIRGNLLLRDTEWCRPEDLSLIAAQAAVVAGDVDLRGVRATGGQLGFRSAILGGVLDAHGARLENTGGRTLTLHQAVVKGSVLLCAGFESHGSVKLSRCTIEGRLDCRDGVFSHRPEAGGEGGGHALEVVSATIRGGMYLGWRRISPSVDLTGASTTLLADDPGNWPDRFVVSGLTYDRFEVAPGTGRGSGWNWRARCDWLARQASFDAGPYEQAARVFRQHGYAGEAENILIRQHRHARRTAAMSRPGTSAWTRARARMRFWLDGVYGLTVGYGYRPGRTLWLLLALLTLVGGMLLAAPVQSTMRATDARGNTYSPSGRLVTVDPVVPALEQPAHADARQAGPTGDYATRADDPPHLDPCGDGQVRCFNPVFYSIDTVIPLVSLEQRSTWYPNEHSGLGALVSVVLHVATLLGWLLSTVVVLAFARLARNTQP